MGPLEHLVPALRAEDKKLFEHCAGILMDNGYGLEPVRNDGEWVLETPAKLVRNRAVVGFIMNLNTEAITIKYKSSGEFETSKPDDLKTMTVNDLYECAENHKVYAVWKMWHAMERLLSDPVNAMPDDKNSRIPKQFVVIRENDEPGRRYTCRQRFCWNPERENYQGREDGIKRVLKNWKDVSSLMISNKEGVSLVQPSHRRGWKTKPILEFGGWSLAEVSDKILYHVLEYVQKHCKGDAKLTTKMKSYVAHAIFAVAQKFKVQVNWDALDDLSESEVQILREYDRNLEINMNLAKKEKKKNMEYVKGKPQGGENSSSKDLDQMLTKDSI